MNNGDNVRNAIFTACREAATEMGDELRGLSWSYRNSVRPRTAETKKAA